MAIIILQGELQSLISNMQLNLYSGEAFVNLVDLFPLLKEGYCHWNTLKELLRCYLHYNNLVTGNYITPDKWVELPYSSSMDLAKFMDENILDWHSDIYGTTSIDKLISIYSRLVLNISPDMETILETEQKLSIIIAMIPNIKKCNYQLYPFLKGFGTVRNSVVYKSLRKHPNVSKLCMYITFGEEDKVKKFLDIEDSRNNQFQAYKLSLQEGNLNIINSVLNNIIYRVLLDKEVLTKYFRESNLVYDIYPLISRYF